RATQDVFTYEQSLVLFAFAYLGGITRVSGAVVGGLLVSGGLAFTLGEELLGVPGGSTLLLGGAGLVVTAILYPDGIAGAVAARATALVPGRGPAGSPGVERPRPAGDAAVAAGSLKWPRCCAPGASRSPTVRCAPSTAWTWRCPKRACSG